MPRLAANLSLLYAEHAFLDRFAAAAADGFDAVECQFPYEWAAADITERLRAHLLEHVLINAPAGDRTAGELGLACLPDRRDEFRHGFMELALPYAEAMDCSRIHVLAGNVPDDVPRERLLACYEANLDWAARQAAVSSVQVLIEPLNPRDNPGYLLQRQDQAHTVVMHVGAPNLKVQMDLYHCQITEGDVAARLRRFLPTGRVGHIQIAGVPERQEPDVGELNYGYLLRLIDALNWHGTVGCEYLPQAGTSAGLSWRQALGV